MENRQNTILLRCSRPNNMFEKIKAYFKQTMPFTDMELELVDKYFKAQSLTKNEYLLQDNKKCDFISFLETGTVRHFHIKDGVEITCDISFENSWVTDFQSFNYGTITAINLQALEKTTVNTIYKPDLFQLYQECNRYESFGRLMAEKTAQRATEIAMVLSSSKPEERFEILIEKRPGLFQRVPQKYIANMLGISPESLSRIKKRMYYNRSKS